MNPPIYKHDLNLIKYDRMCKISFLSEMCMYAWHALHVHSHEKVDKKKQTTDERLQVGKMVKIKEEEEEEEEEGEESMMYAVGVCVCEWEYVIRGRWHAYTAKATLKKEKGYRTRYRTRSTEHMVNQKKK